MGQSFSGALTYGTLKPRGQLVPCSEKRAAGRGVGSQITWSSGSRGTEGPSRIPTLFTSFLIMGSTELNAEPGRFSNLPFSISIAVW